MMIMMIMMTCQLIVSVFDCAHFRTIMLDQSLKQEVDNTVDPLPEYIDGKILTTGTVFTVATTKARTFIVDASKDTTGNNWGDASLKITATPGRVVDRVVVSLVRWKAGDFRFEGTQSGTPAAPTVKVWLGNAAQYAAFKAAAAAGVTPAATSDEVGTQLGATTTLTAAVAPADIHIYIYIYIYILTYIQTNM
jgi:hypothetical protein